MRRSWTLQELLAPLELEFYSHGWTFLGSKRDDIWCRLLASTTGISLRTIQDPEGYRAASIAQKMSWAARREATREEDMAYSLFGISGVNMAPLYGEGAASSFRRLQEEIIR